MIYGKKGAELSLLALIVKLTLLVAVLILALVYVNNVLGDSKFQKEFYSRDVALLLQGMTGAPGNIELSYPVVSEFQLEFVIEPSEVSLYDYSSSPRENRIPTTAVYANDPLIQIDNFYFVPGIVNMSKNNSNINFAGERIEQES